MSETKDNLSNPAPSPSAKPDSRPISIMLTSEEIDALRQDKKDAAAFFKRRFSRA